MPFHIALNMAGAVSAGAYTAGVLDFLIEALDAWYDAKGQQLQQFGADTGSWTIPAHEVMLEVISGASAGGMCSAISSVALQEEFDHIHSTNPGPQVARNRLYQSWVDTIDIIPLLGTVDLPHGQGPVKSLLDSSPISAIAQTALRLNAARQKKRAWIADNLGIILTLTNLRGVPYSVDISNDGSFEERMTYHADRIEFTVAGKGAVDSNTTYALNYADSANPNWGLLATAAITTGAFPVMLAARVMERKRIDYESRLWDISTENPDQQKDQTPIPPAWDDKVVPAVFQNPYVDGGMTNNNPFECARQYLVNAAGNQVHNPRDAASANAAVISVAPFPGDEDFQTNYNSEDQTELGNVLNDMLNVFVNQSRFTGEELLLTADPEVFSRFAIAPSDDTARDKPALLCGSLGAFGGFVDRKFRDHDYQLGRRNCQKFLMDCFVLPEDNPTISLTKTPAALDAVRRGFGIMKEGKYWYPVIPLMPSVAVEVPALNRADYYTTDARIQQVAQAGTERLKTVLDAFVNTPGGKNAVWSFAIAAVFDLGGARKIKDILLGYLRAGLKDQTVAG